MPKNECISGTQSEKGGWEIFQAEPRIGTCNVAGSGLEAQLPKGEQEGDREEEVAGTE